MCPHCYLYRSLEGGVLKMAELCPRLQMSMTYFESHFLGSTLAFTFIGMHGDMQTIQEMHRCTHLCDAASIC